MVDWTETLESAFRAAEAAGFPPFLEGPHRSTAFNASPYSVTLAALAAGQALAGRRVWIDRLIAVLDRLPQSGAEAQFVLLGGSLLDAGADPKDLDCVIFYRSATSAPLGDLAALQARACAEGVDARLMPSDGDPLVFARALLFYGMLYSASRDLRLRRGVVLVDCRAP